MSKADSVKEIAAIPWQYLSAEKKGKHLLDTGLMSDCSFIVGEEPNKKLFNCHKFVLVSASPVFEAMFCNQLKKGNSKATPIPLPEEKPQVFRLFLEFIYEFIYDPCQCAYEEVELKDVYKHLELYENISIYDFDELKALLLLFHKYMIRSLEKKCWLAIAYNFDRSVDDECLLKIFQLAVVTNFMPIMTKCVEFIEDSAIFKIELVYQLESLVFCQLIKLLKSPSSKVVLEIVENYIRKNNLNLAPGDGDVEENEHLSNESSPASQLLTSNTSINTITPADYERNLKIIKELYDSINFMDMKPYEFVEAVKKSAMSKFLSCERKFEILGELCAREHEAAVTLQLSK